MPVTPERVKKLQDLGLTEYQAKTYLALLDIGEASASQLPSLSQVPRTRIYTTMNQLHEKGLVETKPETPIKYRAIPFEKYLEREIKRIKETALELESKRDQLSKEFRISGEEAPPKSGRFRVFYGRRNMMEQVEKMYASAEREILHLGTMNTPGRLTKALMAVGKSLKKRGVKVKIVLPVNLENREDLSKLQEFAEVRHAVRKSIMPILVMDSNQALIADLMKDDKNISLGDSIALWTNDEMIVKGLGEVVVDVWESGIEIGRLASGMTETYNLLKWLLSMDIKTHGFIDRMVEQIGSEMSNELKSSEAKGVFKEMAVYWAANGLGKMRVEGEKPIRLVVYDGLEYATTPSLGNPLCRITESVLKKVIDDKLGVASKVVEEECVGLGDERCTFRIDLGRVRAKKG